MKELTLRCQSCGQSLTIDEACRFVTCAACGAELEAVRNGDAVFTRSAKTDVSVIDAKIPELKRQNDLIRLDQNWEIQRRELLGRLSADAGEPKVGLMYVVLILGIGFLLYIRFSSDVNLGLAGYIPIVAMLFFMVSMHRRMSFYQKARQRYLDRRQEIEEVRTSKDPMDSTASADNDPSRRGD